MDSLKFWLLCLARCVYAGGLLCCWCFSYTLNQEALAEPDPLQRHLAMGVAFLLIWVPFIAAHQATWLWNDPDPKPPLEL